jgi:hypothetical protein
MEACPQAVIDFGVMGMVKRLALTGFLLDVGESLLASSKGEIHPMWAIQGG